MKSMATPQKSNTNKLRFGFNKPAELDPEQELIEKQRKERDERLQVKLDLLDKEFLKNQLENSLAGSQDGKSNFQVKHFRKSHCKT